MTTYNTLRASDVPSDLRWDTPPENQGQVVEVAYANFPPSAAPAVEGALYRRTIDRSDGTTSYAWTGDDIHHVHDRVTRDGQIGVGVVVATRGKGQNRETCVRWPGGNIQGEWCKNSDLNQATVTRPRKR